MEIDIYFLRHVILLGFIVVIPLFLAGLLLGGYFWRDHESRLKNTTTERDALQNKVALERERNVALKNQIESRKEGTSVN